MKRFGVVAILVLAFCGLANSAYIFQSEVRGTPLICNVEHLSDCNTVATSPYSSFLGISLAEYGIFFYGVVFILSALELWFFDRFLRRALQVGALIGLGASLYFTFLQAFVIQAFCIYCLVSALIALLIFFCASLIEPVTRKEDPLAYPLEGAKEKTLLMPPLP